jgi:hypothetical protein
MPDTQNNPQEQGGQKQADQNPDRGGQTGAGEEQRTFAPESAPKAGQSNEDDAETRNRDAGGVERGGLPDDAARSGGQGSQP